MKKTLIALSLAASLVAGSAMAQQLSEGSEFTKLQQQQGQEDSVTALQAAHVFDGYGVKNVYFHSASKAATFVTWNSKPSIPVTEATPPNYSVEIEALIGEEVETGNPPTLSDAINLYQKMA